MPESSTVPAHLSALGAEALRIVLFGMAGAGKSSLLGALTQAAQTQEHILNGHLTDLSQGLTELQRRLYEDSPRGTLAEIVPYPVAFEPFTSQGHGSRGGRLNAILIDCDGGVATDLLTRRRALDGGRTDGSLAGAVLGADALVLTVDASANAARLKEDFTQFGHFLRLLEHGRGQRTEVGGLPVYLVLTKCDLLAQPTDSPADWMERVEERKRQVDRGFQDFLARRRADKPSAFGHIDLHLWATAVKRPALAGSPARPRDPYGVAELFRQALEDARGFRERRSQSERRLFWTIVGSLGLIAVMVALSVGLLAYRQGGIPSALEVEIDRFRVREQEQSPLARSRQVKTKISELTAWEANPAFAQLPKEKQDYVRGRLREYQAYQEYEKALSQVPDPAGVQGEQQLKAIQESLAQLPIPPEYRTEWSETEAGRRHAALAEAVDALVAAVRNVKAGYQKLTEEGQQVLQNKDAPNLPKRAKAVLDKTKDLPDPMASKDRPIPGYKQLTYATVFTMADVAEVYRRWEEVKKKLEPAAKLASL